MRVTFINNGTRDKPGRRRITVSFVRAPSILVFACTVARWDVSDRKPCPRFVENSATIFQVFVSRDTLPPRAVLLRGTRHRCVTHCEMEVSRFRSVQYLMSPCDEGFSSSIPQRQNFSLYIYIESINYDETMILKL